MPVSGLASKSWNGKTSIPSSVSSLRGTLHVAGGEHAAVRHQQRARESQLPGKRTELFEPAFTENDAGADLEDEGHPD